MDIKTLRAVFTGGSYCKTRPLTRQDYGIKLQFVHADLDQYGTYQVHFSNVKDNNGTAKTQIADVDGVVIPDEYLITGKTVYAWAFVQSESAGRTRCMVEIPVAEKPTVTPEEPTPQQRSAIDEAIDALNAGVTRAETAADNAEQSAENAADAETNAAESARLAKLSEDNAAESKDNAKESETNAAASERNAAQSEQNAADSATAATTKAQEAAESAATALTRMNSAASSAQAASQSAQAAAASATAASQSEGNAASSATASAGSATAAAGSASTASTAATTAQGHATNAASSATEASGSATAATNSATAAAQSATEAGNASTAATTAKEAAEDAQEAAEAAAQSIAQSAAQIAQNTSDIGDLNGQINDPVTGLDTKAPVIINSASGDIASFADGAANMPLKALTVNVEPIQDLHGYDSPWPAGGGKNLLNPESARFYRYITDTVWKYSADSYSIAVPVSPNTTYTLSGYPDDMSIYRIGTIREESLPSGNADVSLYQAVRYTTYAEFGASRTITTDASATFLIIQFAASQMASVVPNLQLEVGDTATAFIPYSNICPISGRTSATIYHSGADTSDPTTHTIDLDGTRYGGTLDVINGILIVNVSYHKLSSSTWYDVTVSGVHYFCCLMTTAKNTQRSFLACDTFNNLPARSQLNTPIPDLSITNAYSRYYNINVRYDAISTLAEWKTWINSHDVYVVTPYTPTEITLTAQQIDTLYGTNNIWADAGTVDVEYPADTKMYIERLTAPEEDDMIANAQIASGKYFMIGNNLYLSTTTIPAGDTIRPGTNCIKTNLAEALNALNT